MYFGAAALSARLPQTINLAPNLVAATGGIFLLAGLWTPLMGTLVAVDQVWIALSLYSPVRGDAWIHILLAILAVSVAMLGPGAWSVDARLFGRKRFDIDRTRGRKASP
jgi:putative oxidoreductase